MSATYGVEDMGPLELVELAAKAGLQVEGVRFNEAGLDYRVAFARGADGGEWVLRLPRRPDVSAKLGEEQRILAFVAPRLSVAVPRWAVCGERLVAYPRLPGVPGLTLDAGGQPVWHFDPSSPEFAKALGRLIAELHAIDPEAAEAAGVPVVSAGEVRRQWRGHVDAVRAEFSVGAELERRVLAWLDDDRLWPTTTTFTHGELYAAHVLVQAPDAPGTIVGVLDWTTAKVGDPAVDFSYQHMMGPAALEATVDAYREAGGQVPDHLAERCAELVAAAPILYGVFALQSGEARHRETAAAMLG